MAGGRSLQPWQGNAAAHKLGHGSALRRRARLISVPRPPPIMLATARARLRASEFGMTALAIGVGVLAGLCVAFMTSAVNVAHGRIFGIPFDVRLSAVERISPLAAFGFADAGRASARRDRPMPLSQEGASCGRSARGQRVARRTHVAPPKPSGGDADCDLEWLWRIDRARGRLCVDRRRRRLASGRKIALAPAGSPRARRWRRGRRDRGSVRRSPHGRLLRFRAHCRRLFARKRDSRLRRHPRRVTHHPGDHWRALRQQSAQGRPADIRRLWRADRARLGRGGSGRSLAD